LFKVPIECHYDISMYLCVYPELAHHLHFSNFYLSLLLWVNSTALKILYSSCIERTSPIFTFFTSFFTLPIPFVPSP
jgi:hypothetical protein